MRLRFNVRDLFWLAALTAVCLAWWTNYRQMADRIARLERAPPVVSLSDPAVERAMRFDTLDAPH